MYNIFLYKDIFIYSVKKKIVTIEIKYDSCVVSER